MSTLGPLENNDPERIGRYRLIGRLGAGGMGQVFFGRSGGGRAVAVKRIHPHLATDNSFRERFAREVRAARQVSGAFTAPVIDAGPEDEVPWLVTSYVPSLPLDEAVAKHGPLPEATVRVLAAGLAEALTEIHRVGLIHRDLKPGNVLLAEDGPRVIDFGIARATDGTAATQSIIGTPGFMSPEQVQGQTMTPASDLFAYGAVLSYAATGAGPFGEGNMPTMVMRIINQEPDLSRLPEGLRRLVAACLAKEAQARPTPGQILDYVGDVPVGTSWLPPAVMADVQEQVAKVNRALATSADETTDQDRTRQGMGAGGAALLGGAAGAAAGAAAAHALSDDDATQAGTHASQAGGQDATSVMGNQNPQTGAALPPTQQQSPATARYGQNTRDQQDPYADLYDSPRQSQDRRRREEEERRHRQEDQRRRQEAERAHQQRLRAEQDAARRAQAQARQAGQPGLWSFVKLLPLLILPIIQIPLGYGAALAWSWFTTQTQVWTGTPYYFEPLSMDSFWHATMLGYFLLNNLVALEYLIRSLRTSYVVGAVLALAVVAATNGLLLSFGFWA